MKWCATPRAGPSLWREKREDDRALKNRKANGQVANGRRKEKSGEDEISLEEIKMPARRGNRSSACLFIPL